MRKGPVVSFKVRQAKPLAPILKGLSNISKFLFGRIDFSSQTSSAILNSREEAFLRGNDAIQVEHILFSLLKLGKGNIVNVLENLNCDINALQQQIEWQMDKSHKKEKHSNLPFSTHANNAIKSASSIANDFKSKEIEPEHLLLGIVKTASGELTSIFRRFNLTYDNLYSELKKIQSN